MRNPVPLVFLLPISVQAQQGLSISVSNVMRYGTSNQVVNPVYLQKEYFENLTDTRVGYRDVIIGFRLLHDAPPENGLEFTGISKRHVEFGAKDFVVRAGDSYSLFGRGLALNLFERRMLAFDSGLDGIKASYQTDILRVTATGGTVIYHDVNVPTRLEEYRLRAASFEVEPYQFLSLGFDFVTGSVRLPTTPSQFTGRFDMPGYNVRIQAGNFDAFFSYAEKRSEMYPTFIQPRGGYHKGTGFYGSIGYAYEEIGVTAEYKDYRFGIVDPNRRSDPDRLTKALATQNPPIAHKEHSFTLASRYPHVIDFGDEVGYQFDVYYSVGQLTGNINFAAASRHYSYSLTGDTDRTTLQPIFQGDPGRRFFFPSFSERFSPFLETYAEFQYFLDRDATDNVLIAYNKRIEKTPLELTGAAGRPPLIEVRDLTGLPVAVQHTLSDEWVLKFLAERQWVRDDANLVSKRFFNQLISVGISKSPDLAVTIRYEFTSDKSTDDGRKDWTAIDFAFWLGTNESIMLTAGGDRGGVVCANGVCRKVPPFLGLRASMTSYM